VTEADQTTQHGADPGTPAVPAVPWHRPVETTALRTPALVVAIGGGKGGIGKSVLSALLGIELARRGRRTALVDCDFGGPNLHSLLALPQPQRTLSEYVERQVDSLGALPMATPEPGLALIAGANNAAEGVSLPYQQRCRLSRAIAALDFEVVILDLGAGINHTVLDFFLTAPRGVLVVVPEATSVENAFRFLKAAFLRTVKNAQLDSSVSAMLQDLDRDCGTRPATPAELVARVTRDNPEAGRELRRVTASLRPLLVVNQARGIADLALADSLGGVSSRLFGVDLEPLGHVHHCELLARAVRSRMPLTFENLGRELVADVASVTGKLLAATSRPGAA
jgi:flagellar biosynthesis protein FlhG